MDPINFEDQAPAEEPFQDGELDFSSDLYKSFGREREFHVLDDLDAAGNDEEEEEDDDKSQEMGEEDSSTSGEDDVGEDSDDCEIREEEIEAMLDAGTYFIHTLTFSNIIIFSPRSVRGIFSQEKIQEEWWKR